MEFDEFVYKLPGQSAGSRPGAHRSRSRGAGMIFASHARLFDQPDPRRIDIRASLSDSRHDWLVRSNHQRSSITVTAMIDVSASMFFGSLQSKIDVAAEFLQALGFSAYRLGDSVSLMAFDAQFRDDLYMPNRRGRGIGLQMAAALKSCQVRANKNITGGGLSDCAERIVGQSSLVFLLSDIHWPLEILQPILKHLAGQFVVPIVVWDSAEINPPAQNGLFSAVDAESGQTNRIWLNDRTRQQWRENIVMRREQITKLFSANDVYPIFIEDGFKAEQLSQYFLERVA